MNLRNAKLDDLPTIVSIYNSTIESRMVTADMLPVTVEEKISWFNKHHSKRPLWIVEQDNDTIGWVSLQDFYGRPAYDGTAEISIYLDEKWRGKGFGKMILELSISRAVPLEIHTLLGYIFAHNITSLQLFTNAGFMEWAHLPAIAVIDGNNFSLKIFGKKIMPNSVIPSQ
ncbi:MAG: N-acetyltransferase family protein [Ferruginibacter sp.]